jgi:hypothetical protein
MPSPSLFDVPYQSDQLMYRVSSICSSTILSTGKRLTDLNFSQWICHKRSQISIFHMPSTSCVSSTLTKLNIDVNTFDDCLYLLDGGLDSLSILIINILTISDPLSNIDNTVRTHSIIVYA